MQNPRLNANQLVKAHKLLAKIRKEIVKISNKQRRLIFAFRRKIYKELMYDERSKPSRRRKLKYRMWKKQGGFCFKCKKKILSKGSVLDRKNAIDGYIEKNVRLIHSGCDKKIQKKRKYK